MMEILCQSQRRLHDGRAFSLAETLVSILLVSGLLVVALNTVGAAMVGRQKISDTARGQLLAQDLMAEILPLLYEEPDDTPTFGRESSEAGTSRESYDDVDDYHNWTSTPPEYRDDTAIPGLSVWSRSVVVEYVDSNDLTTVVVSDQGVKRITVTVKRDDRVVASLVAVRGAASDAMRGG